MTDAPFQHESGREGAGEGSAALDEPSSHDAVRPIMLGFFDVLGFSLRLERDGIEAVAATYDALIERAVARAPLRCLNLRWISETEAVPVLFALPNDHAYFSDTILFWAELRPEFVSPFLVRCADFMCEALASFVPLRGVIALGDALMASETGTFIGHPIVEAARLESRLAWAGCTFAGSCAWPPFFPEADHRLILEYPAPVKGDAESILPVHLDWPRRWRDSRESDLIPHLEELRASYPHRYIDETLSFARYSLAEHDWFERPQRSDAAFRMTAVDDLPDCARPGRSARRSNELEGGMRGLP